MPAQVFISYARKDRDQVLPWVKQLQDARVFLWIDEADIDAAHLWTKEITEALDACRVLLLLLSPASVASRQVAREVALASEANTPILPLLLEPTSITGPLRYHLADVQHLELFGADSERRLPAILRALAGLGVVPAAEEEAGGQSGATPKPSPAAAPVQDPARNNLPQALTSFIGREREIAAVKERLAGTRLLTLTGAGGTGKTRLALQVAGDLREAYSDGVWLVELAALVDAALVPQEIARTVGVREEPGRPLRETLLDGLRPKQLLLVLDNCEHLVGACANLAHALPRDCPGVRLMATSREALGVPGESVWRVPSLATPPPPPPPLEQLTQYEAVRLFIDRAVLAQPSFAVTSQNAPAVAAICHRLDGIPLALELAAARVKLLTVEQLLARLEDRFRLLTGGSRTVLPRQQTLRATLDWSYDLLTEAERTLLRRLSVFAGGFTLEAVEAVRGGEAIEAFEVLDLLGQLVEKSLVQTEEHQTEARYHLLETIRQYGAERLAGSGEEAEFRTRHRDWYLALAEQAQPELQGPTAAKWFQRLEVNYENPRAALDWSIERGEGEAGLRFGGALCRFWDVRGYVTEGRERLGSVLALPGAEAGTEPRARTLNTSGLLALHQQDYQEARALYEESLAIYRELGEQDGVVISLICLGHVARGQGEYEAAQALYEESLVIRRDLGHRHGIAYSLLNLGHVAQAQGEYPAARALLEESLAIRRELGNRQGIAYSLEGLAALAGAQGQPERAARLFGAAEALREAVGPPLPPGARADYDRHVAAARAALDEAAFAAAWAEGQTMPLEQAFVDALAPATDA